MQPELLKLSADARAKFLSAFDDAKVKELIVATKDANDSGSFTGLVISTEDKDRQGDIVRQAGIDTADYMLNPVVLNSHNYNGIDNIVGVTTRLYTGQVNGIPATLADGKFAPTEAGQMAKALWEGGFLNAASVGFIPTEFDAAEANVITKWQLLEYSFVPVPANAKATRLRTFADLGLEESALVSKGFVIEAKTEDEPEAPAAAEETETVETAETTVETEEIAPEGTGEPTEDVETKASEIGGTCTLPDGTEGVFATDPNGDGSALVCVPDNAAKGAVSDELNREEVYEQKYAKLDEFFEVIYAFVNVYLDEATTVDQFDGLLSETIALLQNLPTAPAEKGAIALSMKKDLDASVIKYLSAEKSGRAISADNKKKLQKAIDTIGDVCDIHLAEVKSALGDLAKTGETDGGAEEDDAASKGAPAELNDFMLARDVLRKFSTSVDDALEIFNKKSREYADQN